MRTKIAFLLFSFAVLPLGADNFGPFFGQGDMDKLINSYPVMKSELESIFFGLAGSSAQTKEFAEKVDHSSQLMEAFLFWTNGPVISAAEFTASFRDVVNARKPQEIRDLFNKYSLGDNGFGKFFLATTTVLVLYTQRYFTEEIEKCAAGSEERLYLENKLASIGVFLNAIHPDDLTAIRDASPLILRTMM
jgi:hypothetical protein